MTMQAGEEIARMTASEFTALLDKNKDEAIELLVRYPFHLDYEDAAAAAVCAHCDPDFQPLWKATNEDILNIAKKVGLVSG